MWAMARQMATSLHDLAVDSRKEKIIILRNDIT